MPPKVRRPAAAKAAPKGAAAPKRRGRVRAIRRPGIAGEEERGEEKTSLLGGEVVAADRIPLEEFTEDLAVVVNGTYYGAD